MKRSTLILLIVILLIAALTVGTVLLVRHLRGADLPRVGSAEALTRLLRKEGGKLFFGNYEMPASSYYGDLLTRLQCDIEPRSAAAGRTYLRGGITLNTKRAADGSEIPTLVYSAVGGSPYQLDFEGGNGRTAVFTDTNTESAYGRLSGMLGSEAPLTLLSAITTALYDADFAGLDADRAEKEDGGYLLRFRRADAMTTLLGEAVAAHLTGGAKVEKTALASFCADMQSALHFTVKANRLEAITLTMSAPAHTTAHLPLPASTRFEAELCFTLGDAYGIEAELSVKNDSKILEECTLLLSSDTDTEGTLPLLLSITYGADEVADNGVRARRLCDVALRYDPSTSYFAYRGQRSYSDYRNKDGDHISAVEALAASKNAFRVRNEEVRVEKDENGQLLLTDGDESSILHIGQSRPTAPYPIGVHTAIGAAAMLYENAVAIAKGDAYKQKNELYTTILYTPTTPDVTVEIDRPFLGQIRYRLHLERYVPVSGYVKVSDGEDGFVITTAHGTAYPTVSELAEKTPRRYYGEMIYFRKPDGTYLSYRLDEGGMLTQYKSATAPSKNAILVTRDAEGVLSFAEVE